MDHVVQSVDGHHRKRVLDERDKIAAMEEALRKTTSECERMENDIRILTAQKGENDIVVRALRNQNEAIRLEFQQISEARAALLVQLEERDETIRDLSARFPYKRTTVYESDIQKNPKFNFVVAAFGNKIIDLQNKLHNVQAELAKAMENQAGITATTELRPRTTEQVNDMFGIVNSKLINSVITTPQGWAEALGKMMADVNEFYDVDNSM